jgi:hypothetical protein
MHITFVSMHTRLTYNYRACTREKHQTDNLEMQINNNEITHHIYLTVSERKKKEMRRYR